MNTQKKWYQLSGSDADVVISTRIRLARNIRGIPFPSVMTAEQRKKVNDMVWDAIPETASLKSRFSRIKLDTLSRNELVSLVERHLISPNFASEPQGRELLLLDDESVSIMLCEEDHLRIQVLTQGMNVDAAFDTADKLDTLLSERLDFAADPKLGYLTACPTNLGTAMRASVMVHLPSIEATGGIQQLSPQIIKMGLTIRGMYGEGSGTAGALYQISNRETLGISEKDTLDKLRSIIGQIVETERTLMQKRAARPEVEDRFWRAVGVLRSARMMSSSEFIELYSDVRQGLAAGKLSGLTFDALSELFIEAQPATMMVHAGREMTSGERDMQRAQLARAAFAGIS